MAHQLHLINPDQVFFSFPTGRDAEPHCSAHASAEQSRLPGGAAATVRLQVFPSVCAAAARPNCCGRVELAAQTDCLFSLFFSLSALFIRYKAVYNYKPQNSDELELREGDVVQVVEKCDDGWFVGTELISEPQKQELVFPFLLFPL